MLTNTLILLLTAASCPLIVLADFSPAQQYAKRSALDDSAGALEPRADADPNILCGQNYVDCNNGWCCRSGQTCDKFQDIPVCKDPSQTYLGGTAPAYPYKTPEAVLSSLVASYSNLLGSIPITALPTAIASAATSANAAATSAASAASATRSSGAAPAAGVMLGGGAGAVVGAAMVVGRML